MPERVDGRRRISGGSVFAERRVGWAQSQNLLAGKGTKPAPSAATFARLADLIAIPAAADRPTRTVVEVFTGKELTTIQVGTAQDAKDAITRARVVRGAVSRHVDDAAVKGASVLAGGKARPDLGPLFFEPTVLTAPMGGMGVSSVGRRHGPEGLLKYAEPQTVATTRVLNLGGPRSLSPKVWAKVMLPFVKALQWIPGR